MSRFHSVPSPYTVSRAGDLLHFTNEYTSWTHDLSQGGELVAAVVKYGSGENILRAPQRLSLGLMEAGYHQYATCNARARKFILDEEGGHPRLRVWQILQDEQGQVLPEVEVEHSVTYYPWGYGKHHVRLLVNKKIDTIGQCQVGSFYCTPDFDILAVREALVLQGNRCGVNSVQRWQPLLHGKARGDTYLSAYLPASVLLFSRGMEGIELALGDDLHTWDNFGTRFAGRQQTYINFNSGKKAYEVRICPLDCYHAGQSIEGEYNFNFRMTLPFVRPNITPLRPCASGIFYHHRGFEGRWPTREEVAAWQQAGVTLMRLHNDGDSFDNGIFWRDAAYPPYPPAEMAKMEEFLAQANAAGIAVAPYFSCKEYHPEAAGFAEHSQEWARLVDAGDTMIFNYYRNGVFGAQMCLQSGWMQKRKDTIDEVLRKHAFRGVYYDWCTGSECVHDAHAKVRHWDNDKLLELLEWSHQRVGEAGEVYLHLTGTPNLAAENLASLVLTEESGYGLITPLMFTPHVHFVNNAPRQICNMLGTVANPDNNRRLMLCALLHHATISTKEQQFLDFYREPWMQNLSQYRRHTAPGEGKCQTGDENVGMALYWNEQQALAVFVNISSETVSTDWQAAAGKLPDNAIPQQSLEGKITLKPLELQTKVIKL
ncbi:MAG: hypothetical protein GX902_06150 [Lentisphaerae bacterium]|nr:hypothetical protein [Lentisphaerota bacterium]